MSAKLIHHGLKTGEEIKWGLWGFEDVAITTWYPLAGEVLTRSVPLSGFQLQRRIFRRSAITLRVY
jgi:hypothetical protein